MDILAFQRCIVSILIKDDYSLLKTDMIKSQVYDEDIFLELIVTLKSCDGILIYNSGHSKHNLEVVIPSSIYGLNTSATQIKSVTAKEFNSNSNNIYENVESKVINFKRGFGSSKAINHEGTPIILYPGSNSEFDSISVEKK